MIGVFDKIENIYSSESAEVRGVTNSEEVPSCIVEQSASRVSNQYHKKVRNACKCQHVEKVPSESAALCLVSTSGIKGAPTTKRDSETTVNDLRARKVALKGKHQDLNLK